MLHSRKAGTSHVFFWILVSRDTNLLGMFLIWFAPETKGQPLPE